MTVKLMAQRVKPWQLPGKAMGETHVVCAERAAVSSSKRLSVQGKMFSVLMVVLLLPVVVVSVIVVFLFLA